MSAILSPRRPSEPPAEGQPIFCLICSFGHPDAISGVYHAGVVHVRLAHCTVAEVEWKQVIAWWAAPRLPDSEC